MSVQTNLPVPGSGVGCMPQTLSLHSSFTSNEILWYYAVLAGVPQNVIKTRVKLILGFLKLAQKVSKSETLILLQDTVVGRNSSYEAEWRTAEKVISGLCHNPFSRNPDS